MRLLEDPGLAELDRDGLLVDFGTSDQDKVTRGGWRTGWGQRGRDADGTTWAAVTEPTARLAVVLSSDRLGRELVVRLRAQRHAGVCLSVNQAPSATGCAPVGTEWVMVSWSAPGLVVGPNELTLTNDATGVLLYVDWVWLRRTEVATSRDLGRRGEVVSLAGERHRSLVAGAGAVWSFHVAAQRGDRLELALGGDAGTTLSVLAARDEHPRRPLVTSLAAAPGRWLPVTIDLDGLAGEVVRLDLETRGAGSAAIADPTITGAASAATPPAPLPVARSAIVIVLDATRADAYREINASTRVYTEVLSRMAAEGAVFTEAYANSTWTRPCIGTLLTSRYPHQHRAVGVRESAPLAADVTTLPMLAQRMGLTTAAFIANTALRSRDAFTRKWDHLVFYDRRHEASPLGGTKADPAQLYGEALAWLEDHRGERSLVYIHTMGSHMPWGFHQPCRDLYRSPGGHGPSGPLRVDVLDSLRRGSAREGAWARDAYDGDVTCEDSSLSEFVTHLHERGLLDDTLVVVTADHGESFGEHGHWTHTESLHDTLTHVPLGLRHPRLVPAGTRIDGLVQHADLLPTVVQALGGEPPAGLVGRSVLPRLWGAPDPGGGVLIEVDRGIRGRALRIHRWVLEVIEESPESIARQPGLASRRGTHLYDLLSDRAESVDLSRERPVAGRFCEIALDTALGASRGDPVTASSAAPPDPDLLRELRALGYIRP